MHLKYNKGDLFFNGPSDPANAMKGWRRNMVVLMNDVGDDYGIAQLYSLRDKKTIHLKAFNLVYHFHRVQDHA
tara:strand:+ start:289 stop:507 length:219 start_codon:yes stop_codon:yes gene_type:complete